MTAGEGPGASTCGAVRHPAASRTRSVKSQAVRCIEEWNPTEGPEVPANSHEVGIDKICAA